MIEPLAQAAEHLPFKQGVPGSIPGWLTTAKAAKPHGDFVTGRANSSVGQSYRLITGWSGVRVPVGAPALGVWFNGRIGVSKTFDVGSIPTTPAKQKPLSLTRVFCVYGKM